MEPERVRRGLALLRESDPTFQRFGASAHGYKLNPPLPESEVVVVERWYGVRLPDDFRRFLIELGNGGAGPFYGVFRLGEMDDGFGFAPWERAGLVGHLGHPFLETEASNLPACPVDGALPLCHQGCGVRNWLVVTGREAGKVWHDATAESGGWRPLESADGSHLRFDTWYLAWLESSSNTRA